jgi:hypothetical protein
MPKYQLYERVRVTSDKPELVEINGEVGAVLGMAEEDAQAFYVVFIYRDKECWHVEEKCLRARGEFDERENFYDGSRLRVSVDGDGVGRILGEGRDA